VSRNTCRKKNHLQKDSGQTLSCSANFFQSRPVYRCRYKIFIFWFFQEVPLCFVLLAFRPCFGTLYILTMGAKSIIRAKSIARWRLAANYEQTNKQK
jgi:hypothetical protein